MADWVTAIGTLLGGLGAIGLLAATSIGLEYTKQGLDLWRRQMIGTDEYAAAKKIIRTLLDAKQFLEFLDMEWIIGITGTEVDCVKPEFQKLRDKIQDASADATILWGQEWTNVAFKGINSKLIHLTYNTQDIAKDVRKRTIAVSEADAELDALINRLRRFAVKSEHECRMQP